jgi:hypothetical protein
VNFGYAHHAMHLVRIDAPQDLRPGSSVACGRCELAGVRGRLHSGKRESAAESAGHVRQRRRSTRHAAEFAAARARLPVAAPAAVDAGLSGGHLVLTLGPEWGARLARIQSLEFFPYDDGIDRIRRTADARAQRGAWS